MRWGGLETGQLEESGVTFPGSGNQGVTHEWEASLRQKSI